MTRRCSTCGILAACLLLAGCGEATEPDDDMTPEPTAYEVLTECEAAEPCQDVRSFAQLIEGGSSKYLDPGTACVFAGLRERTPGRYLHQADSTWSNGSAGSNHVIVIRDDGSVMYARDSYASGPSAQPEETEPGRRCTLKSRDFFEACHAAITSPGGDPDAAFTCAYSGTTTTSAPIEWFDACEVEPALGCE